MGRLYGRIEGVDFYQVLWFPFPVLRSESHQTERGMVCAAMYRGLQIRFYIPFHSVPQFESVAKNAKLPIFGIGTLLAVGGKKFHHSPTLYIYTRPI